MRYSVCVEDGKAPTVGERSTVSPPNMSEADAIDFQRAMAESDHNNRYFLVPQDAVTRFIDRERWSFAEYE